MSPDGVRAARLTGEGPDPEGRIFLARDGELMFVTPIWMEEHTRADFTSLHRLLTAPMEAVRLQGEALLYSLSDRDFLNYLAWRGWLPSFDGPDLELTFAIKVGLEDVELPPIVVSRNIGAASRSRSIILRTVEREEGRFALRLMALILPRSNPRTR